MFFLLCMLYPLFFLLFFILFSCSIFVFFSLFSVFLMYFLNYFFVISSHYFSFRYLLLVIIFVHSHKYSKSTIYRTGNMNSWSRGTILSANQN